MNASKKWIGLVVWILLCLATGLIGSLFSPSSSPGEWYETLQKSSLNPPGIVFPIVWNILFILMGTAAWRIWKMCGPTLCLPLIVFILQLILNALWSYLFFGLQNPGLAFIEIIILWLAILVTLISFYKIDKLAGYLLVPYLVWVSFAIYLNYAIVQLN